MIKNAKLSITRGWIAWSWEERHSVFVGKRNFHEKCKSWKEEWAYMKEVTLTGQKRKPREIEPITEEQFQWNEDAPVSSDITLADLVVQGRRPSNRICNSGFRRIPNISEAKIQAMEWNPRLEGTGMERRMILTDKAHNRAAHEEVLGRKVTQREVNRVELKSGGYLNAKRLNKYMEAQIKCLRYMVKERKYTAFWNTANRLIHNSVAFRVSAYNFVHYGWYKNQTLDKTIRENLKINKILLKGEWNMILKRVFIEKSPGKYRPLGVPSGGWRVVLHMHANFLGILLQEELARFNHAYLPLKGTLTCIEKWVTDVIEWPYIYEFDIKGFFDNVDIGETLRLLKDRGLPQNLWEYWCKMLESTPMNLDHKNNRYKGMIRDGKEVELTAMDKLLALRRVFIKKFGSINMLLKAGDEGKLKAAEDFLKKEGHTIAEINKGLPQGAAISPLLSLLALTDWKKELEEKEINLLMYADDGILYSRKDFEPFPPKGFKFAEDKSRWIARNGEWLVDVMKFLGVNYIRSENMIEGNTRTGNTLKFGAAQEKLLEMLQKILPQSWSTERPSKLTSLFKSNLKGKAVSRLYGSKKWEEDPQFDDKWQEEMVYNSWYTNFQGSNWELVRSKRKLRTASSKACNWLSSLSQSIINPDRLKTEEWAVDYAPSRVVEGPFMKGEGFVTKFGPDEVKDWREWLETIIRRYVKKRVRIRWVRTEKRREKFIIRRTLHHQMELTEQTLNKVRKVKIERRATSRQKNGNRLSNFRPGDKSAKS